MARKNTEISDIKSRLADILDEVESLGVDEVDNVRGTLEEYLKTASDKAKSMKEDVKSKAIEMKDQSNEYAEGHPWNLAMYSMGIGILVGLLITKSASKK